MIPFKLHPWYLLNVGFLQVSSVLINSWNLKFPRSYPLVIKRVQRKIHQPFIVFCFPLKPTFIGDFPLPGLLTDRSVRIARASKKGGRFLRRSEKKWLKRSSWRSRMPPGSKKKLPWTHEMNSAPRLRLDIRWTWAGEENYMVFI